MSPASPSTPIEASAAAREIPDSTESSPVTPAPVPHTTTKSPPAKPSNPPTTSTSTTIPPAPPPPSIHAHTTPLLSASAPPPPPPNPPTQPPPSPHTLKLHTAIAHLNSTISTTQSALTTTLSQLSSFSPTTTTPIPTLSPTLSPSAIVKSHIRLLHVYNEIKDVGLGLMGMIADARGVRLQEVLEEMGVGEGD